MTIEEQGDMMAFLKARAATMKALIAEVGGEVGVGGPIAALVRQELQPKVGDPDHRTFVSYLVDVHDRALGCLVEVLEPPKLEIMVAVYSEPRPGYAQQADPLLEQLAHNALH